MELQERSTKKRLQDTENLFDIDILVTSRNGDRKIMQYIRIRSWLPLIIRKWNQLSRFRWTSTKVILIEKTEPGYISTMIQGFKRDSKSRANRSVCFSSLSNLSKWQLAVPAQAWQQYSMQGHTVELQRNLATSAKRNFIGWIKAPFSWGQF